MLDTDTLITRPRGPKDLATRLLHISFRFSTVLSPTIECLSSIFRNSSRLLVCFSRQTVPHHCCFVRYSPSSKNGSLVSNTRPLHSAARRSVQRPEHHALLHRGVTVLRPRAKTRRCTSVCCTSKVEDVLELCQVIKQNIPRRLYNQQSKRIVRL